MKKKRSLWISLLSVIVLTAITLGATLAAGWAPKLGLDLDGGLNVVYQTHTPVTGAELSDIVTILNDRVNAGTTGATVVSQGKNQISVSIPGETNTQKILATLGNTAQLLFRPALCYAPPLTLSKGQKEALPATSLPTCASSSQLTQANLQVTPNSNTAAGYTSNQSIPIDPTFAPYASSNPEEPGYKNATVLLPGIQDLKGDRYVLGPAALTGTAIKSASAQLNAGQWAVDIVLTSAGSTAWDQLGEQQFHAIIGIDLDGQVVSAPITQPTNSQFQSFEGQVQISGGFTEDQAKALAVELNYGSLPVKLDRLTVDSVSPSLGKSSLQAGLLSGLAGLILVMLYMLLYYRLLGVVVISGLAVTGGILWVIISFMGHAFGTTIDLAGVIGLIVSVGITVDSYIVYFERLKDEARSGRSIRSSVDRGFASAFRTVLAADAVSLLGAVILYTISIGAVKGFALFLGISTVVDIVMTYFFTRPFVVLLARNEGATDAKGVGVASGLGVGSGEPA